MATQSLCSVDGCGKRAKTRGYCPTHYSRWLIHGDADHLSCPPNGALASWIADHVSWQDDACLIWPFSRNPSGYACQVTIDGIRTYAHRHICRLAHGPAPVDDMDTAHACGNGHLGCVNPKHLRWADRTGNMRDQILHGRTQRGDKHVGSKLSDDDVREIRSLQGQQSQREIATQFGVSQQLISGIMCRHSWAWLE